LLLRNNFVTQHVRPVLIRAINPLKKTIYCPEENNTAFQVKRDMFCDTGTVLCCCGRLLCLALFWIACSYIFLPPTCKFNKHNREGSSQNCPFLNNTRNYVCFRDSSYLIILEEGWRTFCRCSRGNKRKTGGTSEV
jgi:hypothetical protein